MESVIEFLQRESIEGIRDERGTETQSHERERERERDVSIEREPLQRESERPARESLL